MTQPASIVPALFQKLAAGRSLVSNDHGMCGDLFVESPCKTVELSASLSSNNPDSADEGNRASHTLSIELLDEEGTILASKSNIPYEYHGDYPGDHLLSLFQAGDLQQMLS